MVMKKNYFAFVCAICALTLFSCQKEDNAPEEEAPVVPAEEEVIPDGYTQLTLSAVSDETKTTLDGTAVKWAAGDQIKVYCSDASASDFELVGEGGSATGDFTGLVPSGKTALYAVYPKDLYSSVSSSTVNVTIPAAQEGTFGKGNIAVAKVDGEHNMAFKNVNAFVGFTVGADITKVVVSSVGAENLSGTLAVDCSGETPVAGALSDGGSSITVTFPASTGGTYYVAIAPGITHSKGLLLTWYNGTTVTGTYWLNKAITTAANNVYDMETVSADGYYYVSVDGAGKKNGMNAANAWSASQFWSKLHPGGTDAAMDNAKLANINGATFHLAAGTYKWGADAAININESETISFTIKGESGTIFTGDDDNDGTGDHRILSLGGNMNVTFDGISFVKGKVTDDNGGALNIASSGTWLFKGCTFSDNEATKDSENTHGGAIYSAQSIEIEECTMSNNGASYGACVAVSGNGKIAVVKGGTFQNNAAAGNGGAIQVENGAYLEINDDGVLTTNFLNNTAVSYGGALDIETNIKKGETNVIKNAVFKGNQSAYGGAVEVYGGSGKTTKANFNNCTFGGTGDGEPNQSTGDGDGVGGGAFFLEEDVYVVIDGSDFINNSAKKLGGAVFGFGDAHAIINNSKFIGNHGHTGGAIYTEGAPHKSPKTFPMFEIDECSFDGNYITSGYGCTININGINSFCMNNSSIRDSYLVKSSKPSGDATLSWIAIDGIQESGYSSISNCSIIGDTQYSKTAGGSLSTVTGSSLIWIWGTKTYYFTNSIIVPVDSGVGSIKCNDSGATADLAYTHYYDVSATNVESSNNQDSLTSSSLGSLAWNPSGYWTWDGKISGSSTYTKISASDFSTRLSGINSRIVTFLSTDINKDQRGEDRGVDNWWPGAYQN
jgi:predicted outer membrane repeat protein